MIEWLAGTPGPLVLAIAAIVLGAESGLVVGIVLPGATTALGLGVLAHLGVVGLTGAVVTAAAATLLGSQLGFLTARRWDPPGLRLLRRRAGPLLARADGVLLRHPTLGIAAGRLVGGVRSVAPLVAARAGMPYARFAAGDVPVALGWAALLVGLGHTAGAALDEIRVAVSLVGPPLLLVWLVCARVRWNHRVGERSEHGESADPDRRRRRGTRLDVPGFPPARRRSRGGRGGADDPRGEARGPRLRTGLGRVHRETRPPAAGGPGLRRREPG